MKPRIILLEDNESSRFCLVLLLEQKGYEVVHAPDPTICPVYSNPAGTCPHEHPCGDFLLTDNDMPKMTGLEFIEAQVSRGCKGAATHKAVMSGSLRQAEREKAEALGCKIFTKPIRMEDVFGWLNQKKQQLPPDRKLTDLSKRLADGA
ncbi:MAG: response regulator [Desulfuromonadaceae bacterium]|jgi:CheY-like chemotaxis protein